MLKTVLVCYVLFILAAAYVPFGDEYRQEETEFERIERAAKVIKAKVYCAYYTPCAWTVYNEVGDYKFESQNFTNEYCICAPGYSCIRTHDLLDTAAYVNYCLPTPIEQPPETTTQEAQETTTQS